MTSLVERVHARRFALFAAKIFQNSIDEEQEFVVVVFFFSIFSYFYIFDDDDDDDDVVMTSFTDILKTCIPIHLCLKCIMGLRYAWLPPAHCFNKTNTSILTLL